jgi:hypothetical protein
MRFGKNETHPMTQMPRVVRPIPADLDQLNRETEEFYEQRGPTVLPMDDVANGIAKIVEDFGKRPIPADIPKVYQELIKQLHSGVQDMGRTFVETARAAEELENDIVSRCRAHENYMKREMTIAKKVREKYGAIAAEIKAELAAEEEGEGK